MNPDPLDEYKNYCEGLLKVTQDILETLYGNRMESVSLEKILTDANSKIKTLAAYIDVLNEELE